jgi:hypothetical protein
MMLRKLIKFTQIVFWKQKLIYLVGTEVIEKEKFIKTIRFYINDNLL